MINVGQEDPKDRIIVELNQEVRELKEEVKHEKNDKIGNRTYLDISLDAERLDKAARRIDRRMRKCKSDGKYVKLANSLAFLISKKMPLLEEILHISELVNKLEKKSKIDKRFNRY